VAQTTFEEISASDYVSLYNQGYSIDELKKIMGYSYTYTRNMLLKSGAKLRTRKEDLSKLQKQRGCSEDFRFLV
jgi:hypothetical protein